MELIERYIDAVVRFLSPRQRPDISRELRALIEDKLQQRTGGRDAQTADIEAVLLELGDPRRLADKYRGTARYLIGPVFFELYWLVLRIALVASAGGVLLALLLEMAGNPPTDVWQTVARVFSSVWNALITAFGMVTLIFAINERFNDKVPAELPRIGKPWHPGQLPPRAASRLLIRRAEPIVAIVFSIIVLIIININIDVIGFYVVSGQLEQVAPLFSDLFASFLPWLNLSIGLAIIIECIKLITGRWTMPIVIGSLVQKSIGLLITLTMFADSKIFNPAFFSEFNRIFNDSATQMPIDLPARIAQAVVIIAIVAFVIDALSTISKGVRILLGIASNNPAENKK